MKRNRRNRSSAAKTVSRRHFLKGAVGTAALLKAPAFIRNAGASQLRKVKFQLAWIPSGEYTPWFAAKEMGFWSELGLDVEIFPWVRVWEDREECLPRPVRRGGGELRLGREYRFQGRRPHRPGGPVPEISGRHDGAQQKGVEESERPGRHDCRERCVQRGLSALPPRLPRRRNSTPPKSSSR